MKTRTISVAREVDGTGNTCHRSGGLPG